MSARCPCHTGPNQDGPRCKNPCYQETGMCYTHYKAALKAADVVSEASKVPLPEESENTSSGWEGLTLDTEMMDALRKMEAEADEVVSRPPPPLDNTSERIATLERELAAMKLERARLIDLLNTRARKHVDPFSDDRVLAQAKMLNYHDNKDREDIRTAIVDKLSKAFADYPKMKPYRLVVGKDGKSKYVIAWELVKEATDIVWDELEEGKKAAYRDAALGVLKERVAKRAAKKRVAKVGA